jgi:hypothetical protein
VIRGVLIGVALLVLPIGIYYRVKSQATREKLDRRQEGLFILATLRPLGLALCSSSGPEPKKRIWWRALEMTIETT